MKAWRMRVAAGVATLLLGASGALAQQPVITGAQIPGANGSLNFIPQGVKNTYSFTIASGTSLSSNSVDLGAMSPVALVVPSVWTGNTTAITFQAAVPLAGQTCATATYDDLYESAGTEAEITVAAPSTFIAIATTAYPATLAGVRCLKLRSGTSGAPVNQAQDTTVYLVAVPGK